MTTLSRLRIIVAGAALALAFPGVAARLPDRAAVIVT